MTELGKVPRRGDVVSRPGFEMTVRRMDGRRVREVELTVEHIPDTRDADHWERPG
jgi:CBS domain containing-hemolysin-like protein